RFRRRARHDRIDDDLLDRAFGARRRQLANHFVRVAVIFGEKAAHARARGRYERKPIAPALLKRKLGEVFDVEVGFDWPAGEPIDLAPFRPAVATDQKLWRGRGAIGRRLDLYNAHAAAPLDTNCAPITASRPSK